MKGMITGVGKGQFKSTHVPEMGTGVPRASSDPCAAIIQAPNLQPPHAVSWNLVKCSYVQMITLERFVVTGVRGVDHCRRLANPILAAPSTEDLSVRDRMSFTLAGDLPLGFDHGPAIETFVSRPQIAGSAASQLP